MLAPDPETPEMLAPDPETPEMLAPDLQSIDPGSKFTGYPCYPACAVAGTALGFCLCVSVCVAFLIES